MNKLTIYPLLFLLLLSVGGCRDMVNDAEISDPLLALEGTYKMESFQYRYLEYNDEGEVITDTTLSMGSHPYITLKKAEGYADKIEMDSREFIEDLFFTLFASLGAGSGATFTVDLKHPRLIEITGHTFVLDGARFDLTISNGEHNVASRGTIAATGNMEQDTIHFDFEIYLGFIDHPVLTGTATGIKI